MYRFPANRLQTSHPSDQNRFQYSCSFEIPEKILTSEIQARFEEALRKDHNLKFQDFEKSEKPRAEKSIRLWYLTQNIGKKENILITDEEVNNFVTNYAISNRLDIKKELEKIKKDTDYLHNIKSTIFQGKVANLIVSKVNKKIIKLSKKEFDKINN